MKKLILTLIAVIAIMAVGCKPEDPKVEVTGVKLSLTTVELTVEGTQSLVATIEPADATDKALTWSSSDEAVATVDQSGKVTAVAPGTATITVKSANVKTASCKVTVSAKAIEVTGISLDHTALSLGVGESAFLISTIAPEDATDKTITWTSSSPSVATVAENGSRRGKVTAVSPGTTTITVISANGKTATCTVTVPTTVPVTGVVIASGQNHMVLGFGDMTMSATVSPSNATNKNITWSVDDPSVVKLSDMTNSSCVMTGLKEGYTILKVTTQDGNKVGECLISVHNNKQTTSFFKSSLRIPTRMISAGNFLMGSLDSYTEAIIIETPQHSVTLTKAFYMSKFETTNSQFAEFLNAKNVGINGTYNGKRLIEETGYGVEYNATTSKWQAAAGKEHYPVVKVSWYGASEFATWVGGRLPTEAEWEYACRAGTTTPYYWGSTSTNMGNYAWYEDNSNGTTHPVGKKQPNNWGLYDMNGNVWEWCSDWYSPISYSSSAQVNPTGPTSGTKRVLRGGGWTNYAEYCRSARRGANDPTGIDSQFGFRVVFD